MYWPTNAAISMNPRTANPVVVICCLHQTKLTKSVYSDVNVLAGQASAATYDPSYMSLYQEHGVGGAGSGVGIHAVLEHLATTATSNRDKGDKLERLILSYLRTDPMYAQRFSSVWLWNDWPERGVQVDTGIDLVAQERDTGDYIAIQCKFHQPGYLLQKSDIDSFFTASGKHPFKGRLVVSTSDRWSKHAEEALANQQIPVSRLRIQDLASSPIDWGQFTLQRPEDMELLPKKQLRPHQVEAHANVVAGLQKADRGKLIMACGTGKTFTSLKIAETMVGAGGNVLFLVPSLSLLSQTLGEWTGDSHVPLRSFAVCSDTKIGRSRDDEDLKVYDLAFPSTTDPFKLHDQLCIPDRERMTVVFSTYQSIDVVSQAQALGDVPSFDLVIADEAHRTTGAMLQGEEQSHFTKVHDPRAIKAKKRLYMTATPRLYSDEQVARAVEKEAVLWSMDDPDYYGEELHRLNFGEAVSQDLLSDYKVMILAVDEKYISKAVQRLLKDEDNELTLDDAVKIVGCWNGLAKRTGTDAEEENGSVEQPMRRAVAFAGNIKASKKIAEMFTNIVDAYTEEAGEDEDLLHCEAEHVDGTFNVLMRNHRLDWLKEPTPDNTCRILTNARCLSEGVDVPSLDAVMFLQPRDSEIDIVQAVGRVMRKVPGKEYGYVILPIGVPAGVSPEEALSDNKKYRVVWQVLQALRAHDERFDSTINKLELNKRKPDQIAVIGVGGGTQERPDGSEVVPIDFGLENIGEWRDAIYARIVQKVGTSRYWESWAKDVADIAERHVTRIEAILEAGDSAHLDTFEKFLEGLRRNLNPAIDRADAIEMLSQHLITKPVFEALFEGYSFAQSNPVSVAMQKMVDVLEGHALEKETQALDKFYESVRQRASRIDNAEGKQRVIIQLYDKFFRTAFPRMAERLGIVYTPIEVVDYILKSADHALKAEFGRSLTDEGVHILDPFTGTGTFLVRLIQSGLIKLEDLPRKYQHELHANEIVLLAYYIAAINIEEAYHEQTGWQYEPFEGIVLTDTFQLTEDPANGQAMTIGRVLPENSERATKQKALDITVIVGNPPYSAWQGSENDANKNLAYPNLDERIRTTYAANSSAVLKNSLYDSYVRAIRWASDRIGDKGIVCFVTNGGFIDGNAADGLRKTLIEEFSSLYIFNLRGNQRTSGETSRREGGKIFDSGSRATIAISLLLKNPDKATPGKLYYHDIGDYLSREEKLETIHELGSVAGTPWQSVVPNERHDWINQRGDEFRAYQPLGVKNGRGSVFSVYSGGLKTNRDPWVYNYSKRALASNIRRMIEFYNEQVENYTLLKETRDAEDVPAAADWVSKDPTKISWTRELLADLRQSKHHPYLPSRIVRGLYRPFSKQWVYFDRRFNNTVYQMPRLFPNGDANNLVIYVTGSGGNKPFSAVISNVVPNIHLLDTGQAFPLYYYEETNQYTATNIFDAPPDENGYVRKDAITDGTLTSYRKIYDDSSITKEDIFYYIYGVLHSVEYRERFEADLKKELPRIPYAKDFHAFAQAGRQLGNLHVNYERAPKYPVTVKNTHSSSSSREAMRVTKMRFTKKDDRSRLKVNAHITISDIPDEAHGYVVNGRTPIEWLIDRYQVTTDKKSGIKNDPNEWSDDPCYILDLIQRVITVSVETVRIVNSLPPLGERVGAAKAN
ncbi:MAG TPA: type ISP restriction/modification enzyme [Trueperaceae bacterium]|nr:type ISP restriction/modification enzyme [Trueperaceae bacterium]